MPKPNCLDCQKLLTNYRSKKCRPCSFRSTDFIEKMRGLAIRNGNKPPRYDATGKHWKIRPACNEAKSVQMKADYASGKRKAAWTGKKQSKESIEKRKLTMIGYKHSPETRLKIAASKQGAKSHFWRGGKTEQTRLIRQSSEYKMWREAVFKRDDYTCQVCHIKGGRLNADHIKPFAKFPELRMELGNGRTLCHQCHKKTESYGVNDWQKRTRNNLGHFKGFKSESQLTANQS